MAAAQHTQTGQAGGKHAAAAPAATTAALSPAREAARTRTRRRRRRRGISKIVVAIIVLAVVAAGIFGYTEYKALKEAAGILKADAATVMAQAKVLKDQALAKDFEAAQGTTNDIRAILDHMDGVLAGKEFDRAALIPKYGKDVDTARQLLAILEDLCDDAASPLLQSLIDNPLSDLYSAESGINMPAVHALLDTVDPIVPVLRDDVAALAALPDFRVPQLRDKLAPAMETAREVDAFLQSFGDISADLRSLVDDLHEVETDAMTVTTQIKTLKDQATAQDFAAAQETATDVRATLGQMADILAAEEFDHAALIPTYGGDVGTARELLTILEELCDEAASPLLESLVEYAPSGLYSKDSGINVPGLYALLDALDPVVPVVQAKIDALDALSDFALPLLRDKVAPALQMTAEANELLQSFGTVAELRGIAHAFLGDSGNKVYLIVAQNSAEMRSTGGFPGSVGLLRISNGKLSVGDFSSCVDVFEVATNATYGITDTEMTFTKGRVIWTHGAGYQPDFGRAAWIWARAYERRTGTHVDGVISLTPATVQHVLAFAGPITLSDGTELTGDNATRILQCTLYWKYLQTRWEIRSNADYVDRLFSEAAKKAFDKLKGSVSLSSLPELLDIAKGCIERHEALVWLANVDDRPAIASLHCSGIENKDPATPVMGVFFNTFVASKTGWYVDQTIEIGEGVRNADGTTSYPVKVTWVNTITEHEGRTGGSYIMGSGNEEYFNGIDNGYMMPIILLWAPCGGSISGISDSLGVKWSDVVYEGNQLWYEFDAVIPPQGSFVVTYTVTVPAEATSPLTYWSQPTLTEYR